MKRTLSVLFILACAATSENYGDRHGNNYFSSGGKRYFPIIWDVRGTLTYLDQYRSQYFGNVELSLIDLQSIFEQAANAGVNAVSLRKWFNPETNPDDFTDVARPYPKRG